MAAIPTAHPETRKLMGEAENNGFVYVDDDTKGHHRFLFAGHCAQHDVRRCEAPRCTLSFSQTPGHGQLKRIRGDIARITGRRTRGSFDRSAQRARRASQRAKDERDRRAREKARKKAKDGPPPQDLNYPRRTAAQLATGSITPDVAFARCRRMTTDQVWEFDAALRRFGDTAS